MRALEVETLTKFRGKIGKNDKLLYDDINKTKSKKKHAYSHALFILGK